MKTTTREHIPFFSYTSFMSRGLLFLIMLGISTQGYSTTTQAIFAKYTNPYFVETGTCEGDGVQMAIDAGFPEVYSIELSPNYFDLSAKRFKDNSHVHLFFGDSAKVLSEVIAPLTQKITFWLDGHCSYGDTARGETMTPLMNELEAIKQHPIKTHTILIDDVREFGTVNFDYLELSTVIKKIQSINPNYTITFEDGYIKNDVLVAYIKETQ